MYVCMYVCTPKDSDLYYSPTYLPTYIQVLDGFLNQKKEFRRLHLIVFWLEYLRERDLWMLKDEIDGLVGGCTYIHTYIHTYVRTYIYAYIHTYLQEGYEMWPSTCQREGVLALDPDFPYHSMMMTQSSSSSRQQQQLATVDEKQDFTLLERIWRYVGVWRWTTICLYSYIHTYIYPPPLFLPTNPQPTYLPTYLHTDSNGQGPRRSHRPV